MIPSFIIIYHGYITQKENLKGKTEECCLENPMKNSAKLKRPFYLNHKDFVPIGGVQNMLTVPFAEG